MLNTIFKETTHVGPFNVLPLKYANDSDKKIKIKLYALGGTCIEPIGKINLNSKVINKNDNRKVYSNSRFEIQCRTILCSQ